MKDMMRMTIMLVAQAREKHFNTLDDKNFVTKPTVMSVLESIEDKIEFPTNKFNFSYYSICFFRVHNMFFF